jgi:hypothetical protein
VQHCIGTLSVLAVQAGVGVATPKRSKVEFLQ